VWGEGSVLYTDATKCRYARWPLPPPALVVPGETNSTQCGCQWTGARRECSVFIAADGAELLWTRSFPNFDSLPMALLALFQVLADCLPYCLHSSRYSLATAGPS
jgi:hypothetical protein